MIWTPGAVEPSLNDQWTTNANCGVLYPRAGLKKVTADTAAGDGQSFEGMDFVGKVNITGSPRFLNCNFSGFATAKDGTGQANCLSAQVGSPVFDFCTFNPDNPIAGLDAILGHGYTVRRSILVRGTDGAGSYNQNSGATRVDNHLEGCYIGQLSWWYPDPTGIHKDGTHCDDIQHQGQAGLWVVGCSIHGYVVPQNGSDLANNPSGSAPNRNQAGQIIMLQNNTGPWGDVHILDNWFYGGANGISARNNGDGKDHNFEMKRNQFMDNGQKKDGSHINYLRADDNTVIDLGNGPKAYRTGYTDAPGGPDANVYGYTGKDAQGVAVAQGQPIKAFVRVP